MALGAGTAAPATAEAAPPHPWTYDAPGWGWQLETYPEDESTRTVWYTSPHGTFTVPGGWTQMSQWHRLHGGGRGVLGYPVSSTSSEQLTDVVDVGIFQRFERGILYSSDGGAHATRYADALTQVHRSLGGGRGSLGYPTSDVNTQAAGFRYQTFRHGVAYSSPVGTFGVWGALNQRHRSHGGGTGLGYPTSHRVQESRTHYYQVFERGVVYCFALTRDQDGCSVVTEPFRTMHAARGGGSGDLGYPIHEARFSDGRLVQTFEGGTLVATP